MNILLEASNDYEKYILNYLKENASEALAEKINNGKKTLTHCMQYITGEARKSAKNGMAMIKDEVVYGWAVHFFEEDSIEVASGKPAPAVTVKKENKPAPKPEPKKEVKKNNDEMSGQMSLFDFLGGE